MEQSRLSVIDDDRCQNLRWNGLYIQAVEDPSVQQADHSFWCQKTQQVLGPDGRVVDDYECNPFRRCYEEV